MAINFEDQRSNRVLKSLIDKEFEKLYFSYTDVKSLNFYYTREVLGTWLNYIGTKDAYFFDSGTTALFLAFKLLGVESGDEVIMPVGIYPAAALTAQATGATPVFADTKRDGTMDLAALESNITKNTKAVLPVHMYGVPSDMEGITGIARKHNLKILEDVCQAHGGMYKGKKLGRWGDLSVHSFNPHKTISTLGGGGSINFDNENFREEIYKLIQYDLDDPWLLEAKRSASSMSYADMAFLNAKIKAASAIKKSKDRAKQIYERELANLPDVEMITDSSKTDIVWQFFLIYASERDELFEYLKSHGVITRLPYSPLYNFKMFQKWTNTKEFPQAEKNYNEGICLPIFPFIKTEEVEYVCQKVKDFYLS